MFYALLHRGLFYERPMKSGWKMADPSGRFITAKREGGLSCICASRGIFILWYYFWLQPWGKIVWIYSGYCIAGCFANWNWITLFNVSVTVEVKCQYTVIVVLHWILAFWQRTEVALGNKELHDIYSHLQDIVLFITVQG